MHFNLIFESNLYLTIYRSCGQLQQDIQVEDTATVSHFFACSSYQLQGLNTFPTTNGDSLILWFIRTFGFGVALRKSNGSWGSRRGRLLLIHCTFGVRLIEAQSALVFLRGRGENLPSVKSSTNLLGQGKALLQKLLGRNSVKPGSFCENGSHLCVRIKSSITGLHGIPPY